MARNNKKRKTHDPGVDELVLELQDLVEREESSSLGHGKDMVTVFAVPAELRDQKPEAYKPVMVSLGPYHDYTIGFVYKKLYLMEFLKEANKREYSVEAYVKRIRDWKEESSSFYSGMLSHYQSDLNGAFTRMLVYNCCFLVEVIRKYAKKDDDHDAIVSVPHRLADVLHDMLLVENQLPFNVLQSVFENIRAADSKSFEIMVAEIINDHFYEFGSIQPQQHHPPHPYPHLLDFVHRNWCPNYSPTDQGTEEILCPNYSPTDQGTEEILCPNYSPTDQRTEKILSASELREKAAVNFRFIKVDDKHKFFDVSFKNGTFNIPTIRIDKKTEDLLRNMMAYERTMFRHPDPDNGGRNSYVTHYMILMSWLINTTYDVKLLCDSGIINRMGMDHDAIRRFFVAFGVYGQDSCPGFFYTGVAAEVKSHCDKNCNKIKGKGIKWIAALKREIFPSPWAYVSFFAALTLLVLTLLQTINSF